MGCSVNPNNIPAGRIEEWVPLTGGNNFYQNFYGTVWGFIGTKAPFPDTCACTTFQDNGAGISWNFSIPTGGSATYSHFTTFSPLGLQALVTSKTADSPTSVAGSQNGYTITIENGNPDPVTLNSITDTLPAGFSYVSGSTTGVTTNDPAISAQLLTWSGPFVVPANSSVSLHFAVTVASTAGDYFNEAGGEADGGYTVNGTGPTAPITVTPRQPPPQTRNPNPKPNPTPTPTPDTGPYPNPNPTPTPTPDPDTNTDSCASSDRFCDWRSQCRGWESRNSFWGAKWAKANRLAAVQRRRVSKATRMIKLSQVAAVRGKRIPAIVPDRRRACRSS